MKNQESQLFIDWIDFLKSEHKIPGSLAGRRIGMTKHTIQNIRRGTSEASSDDLKALAVAFYSELKDKALEQGIKIDKETSSGDSHNPDIAALRRENEILERENATLRKMVDDLSEQVKSKEGINQDLLKKLMEFVDKKIPK